MTNMVEKSAVTSWLRDVSNSKAEKHLQESALQMLSVIEEASTKNKKDIPFLTVVMRTQGKRFEAFRDALLSLYGQTDKNFELLIMGHNVENESATQIQAILAEQPDSFRSRITYIPVSGGLRARPLNVALESGKGQYFAFFDDDDVLFANWVETFHEVSREHPGQLIRTVTAAQDMTAETWRHTKDGFRSISGIRADYPQVFDYTQHLEVNRTPFMSTAYPRELFTLWGERFDEFVTVCEDWDMFLRGAFLLGVASGEEMTAIYRRWNKVSSSATVHDYGSWRASEARISENLNRRSVILPQGGVQSIINQMHTVPSDSYVVDNPSYDQVAHQLQAVLNSRSWRFLKPVRWVTGKARVILAKSMRLR